MDGLDKARHVKYWQRCHNSYLPAAYTGNDSTRLTFACFIVSALDLLSVPLTPRQRSATRTWVLSLQHPDGGFCGSPAHVLSGQDAVKGAANVAATFFGLLLLGIAAQSDKEAKAAFAGVERKKLLRWLRRLQREDGSFGQNLWDGEAVGGKDMRHSYLVACIRWMLRGDSEKGEAGWEEDVDVDRMVAHTRRGQTYDGGVSEASEHESHAGYAYCAIAALYMLDRPASSSAASQPKTALNQGVVERELLLKFLAHRQFPYLVTDDEASDDEASEKEDFVESELAALSLNGGCKHVGFNGRWNKPADTCYYWWVGGTLALLDNSDLINMPPSRKYLEDITQHRIGGFSKTAGGPPDIYHSYLGLAALAIMGETELKDFDVGLCCSKETARKIVLAREGLLESTRTAREEWDGDGFWEAAR